MKENSGMDASDEFWDIGHSEQAMDDMKQYIIGQLSDEDCAALKEKPVPVVLEAVVPCYPFLCSSS